MDFVDFWSGNINIVEVCMEYVLSGSCQQITSSGRCRNYIINTLFKRLNILNSIAFLVAVFVLIFFVPLCIFQMVLFGKIINQY